MKSNRASTSAMPSSTFTYATTYTVPRSSPMLSSSCTPFYPRSQQQIYHPVEDAGCFASSQEFNDVHKGHSYEWPYARDPRFYNHQCYTSPGPDHYKVSLASNDGNWWGVPEEYVYADDEADYLHSDSLSYYAESPGMEQEFYAHSTSNTTSVQALYPDPGAATFNVPHISAKLEQASCSSKDKELLTSSVKNSFIHDQSVPYCAFAKQIPAKSMTDEVANAFSSGKLDARPFPIQVSSQMCPSFGITSLAVEPKMKQATTDMSENRCAPTDRSKLSKTSCCNSSDEHGLPEAVKVKHSIQATSNPSNMLELLEGINLDAPAMSISAEVNRKEADNRNSSSLQSSSSQLQSSSGQCPDMPIPNPINAQTHYSSVIETAPLEQRNMGCLASLVMEMEGKQCVEAIDHEAMHQDKTGSSYSLPGDAWLYLNGPQLLVKCIHNLSKVLLSSESGTPLNILDPTDCFAIENTICILSHRLSQSCINEGNFCRDQSCHQVAGQKSNISDAKSKLNEEAGSETLQQKGSFLLEGMKHKLKMVRILENEPLDGSSKVTASTCVKEDERADQSLFVKKEFEKPLEDLLMLGCYVTKLQEEVAYERAESNATVTSYKRLWIEAQEALKVSRSEIKELKAELASLKQDFKNLKHSGGMPTDTELTKYDMKTSCISQGGLHENLLDVKTGSSQSFTTRSLNSAPNDDINSAFCGSSKESFPACSEVVTEYFVPKNISNCKENTTPYAKGEITVLRHNNPSGKRFEIFPSEPSSKHAGGTNPEAEVTRRLSLLLARQGLDLNKTYTDRNEELPSGFSTILEASSHLRREGEALPPDKNGNHLIWSDTSYTVNADIGIEGVKADLSCQTKPAFEIKYGDHSLVQRQFNSRSTEGVDVEDVKVSTCQEDEIEIICLKPGVAESNHTFLKGEPEWEHVVLDDQKTSR